MTTQWATSVADETSEVYPEVALSTRDRIAAIVDEPSEHVRAVMVEDFLAHTERLNRSIAATLCRDYKADRNTWFDDFCQLVRIAAHALVEECIAHPERLDEVRDYQSLLGFRARSAATKFVDSSAGFNTASGQAGLKRRRRELERTRASLYMRGYEPTDQEIVDATNERMLAQRADAARQGMICSIEDLHMSQASENIEDHRPPTSKDVVENDAELHASEREALVAECIAACREESVSLGRVAELWFRPATGADAALYDGPPTAASIAKVVGIEASTARAKVARVRQVSQRVARDRFGMRRET